MNKIKEFFEKFIKDKKDIYTIPNILVYFRFLLVIVFIVIYFLPISVEDILINHYICAGIVLLAGFTDFLDGQIARRFNMVTELGKAIDPLADKLMQFAIALCLLITYFHIWTFILMLTIFVIKEITLLIFDIVLFKKEKKLDGAKFFGKVSTFVFYVYSSNKRIAIPSDKNNVLLKETMKRAERKLTRVEFIKRHPNAF